MMDLSGSVSSSSQSNPYGSYTMDQTSLKTPEEWDWAMNLYKNYAGGAGRVKMPEQWNTGANTLTQMTETGMPTDISGWWEAQKPVFATAINDYSKQAAETAGMGGTRWSSPLLRNISEFTQRGYDELTATAMAKQLEADEAAKARQIEASNQLLAYTKYKGDLMRSNVSSRYNAIGDVLGLATQKFYAPMTIAAAIGAQGNNLYNQQSNQNQELTNPAWVQGATNALAQSPQTTYQPSFAENMLGAAASTLPYTKWFNQGGSDYSNPSNWATGVELGNSIHY